MTEEQKKSVKILYDDIVIDDELYPDWGVSIYLDTGEYEILFDVGHDKNILLNNMDKLNTSKEDIDIIVISHRHWDHMGGLSAFEDQDVKIYVPDTLNDQIMEEFELQGRVISVTDSVEIANGIYSTGELGRAIKEQSLIVENENGVYILTGCGHPGIDKIVEEASKIGKIKGIIGGYHGFDDLDLLEDIPLLVPCHCTMLLDKIEERFPDSYRRCGVGTVLNL
ncbi:MAG: MBL fold metallo-hydrolase [Candidatus Thermoplasmatota archaeon]|nr:MBL fold metallo-hydrolase [Candidatus Thermoplasmatota archaeon]MBS3789421.1 MBL fold metallo-hydrolase [Candidatus Thermoplasmatota archaeon]